MLVLDATVLINFGGVEAFGILRQSIDTELVAVDAVVDEVSRPPASTQLRQAIDRGWILRYHLSTDDELEWEVNVRLRAPRLGAGEVASLAVCFAHGWDFASDDRDARRIAVATVHNRPTTITGTIGIILTAVRSGVIEMTAAELIYQEMLAAGFRAPVRRLADWLGSN